MSTKRKLIRLQWRCFFLSPYFWVGIIIILLGAILFALLPRMQFCDNYVGLILAFVGIMSTFIVISNFSQVAKIERETKESIYELEKKHISMLKEMETLSKEYSRVLKESYQTQKTIYEQQIRAYYPELKNYLYIVSRVYNASIWKNNEIARKYRMGGENLTCEERKSDNNSFPFLNIFLRIREMALLYSRLITEETVELISYKEIEELTTSANMIWWSYDRDWKYYKEQVNEDAFNQNIQEHDRKCILLIVKKLAPDYYDLDIVDYATLAMVSGIAETNILQPLKLLTAKYESVEPK